MITRLGTEVRLGETEIREVVDAALAREDLRGRRVLALLPDTTRTAPVSAFFRAFHAAVSAAGGHLDCLVALGTHPPLSRERYLEMLGLSEEEYGRAYSDCRLLNHQWDNPAQLVEIGVLDSGQIAAVSDGMMRYEVAVTINRLALEYDLLLVLGPVVPHEVVGFSGGDKYFFPGIAGAEIIDFFHWLGAINTIPRIIGVRDNPVRRILSMAASFLKTPRIFFNIVMADDGLAGIFAGKDEESWRSAADLSAELHIHYKPRQYRSVLGIAPAKYDDLWTGGKVAYKLDGLVEDGGELIIYAPHIREVSITHGPLIEAAGYHVRDYFFADAERFAHIPGRIKAHSTHVKGTGTYRNGVESPRINVVLATGISAERCQRINLGYRNPGDISPADWEGREDEGFFLVRNAGERLFRVAKA